MVDLSLFTSVFPLIRFRDRLPLRHVCTAWNNTIKEIPVSAIAVVVLEVPVPPSTTSTTPVLTFDDLFKDSPPIDDEISSQAAAVVILRGCSLTVPGFPFEPASNVVSPDNNNNAPASVLLRTSVNLKTPLKSETDFKTQLSTLFRNASGCQLGTITVIGDASKPRDWSAHFPSVSHLESTILETFENLSALDFWIEFSYFSDPIIVGPLHDKISFRFLSQELCLWGPIALTTPNLVFLEVESDEIKLADQGPDSLLAHLSQLTRLETLVIRGMVSINAVEMNYISACRGLKHLRIDGPLHNMSEPTILSFTHMMETLHLKSFGISWSPVVYTALSEWIAMMQKTRGSRPRFSRVVCSRWMYLVVKVRILLGMLCLFWRIWRV